MASEAHVFYVGKVAELRRVCHMHRPPTGAKVTDARDRLSYRRWMRKAELKGLRRQILGGDLPPAA